MRMIVPEMNVKTMLKLANTSSGCAAGVQSGNGTPSP
jgi:hypothetical protein